MVWTKRLLTVEFVNVCVWLLFLHSLVLILMILGLGLPIYFIF